MFWTATQQSTVAIAHGQTGEGWVFRGDGGPVVSLTRFLLFHHSPLHTLSSSRPHRPYLLVASRPRRSIDISVLYGHLSITPWYR